MCAWPCSSARAASDACVGAGLGEAGAGDGGAGVATEGGGGEGAGAPTDAGGAPAVGDAGVVALAGGVGAGRWVAHPIAGAISSASAARRMVPFIKHNDHSTRVTLPTKPEGQWEPRGAPILKKENRPCEQW
jgi:hypothetical protein